MEQEGFLPPGFRFYPTEEELITFYLYNKLHGNRSDHLDRVIPSINIYNFEPPQLPGLAGELCKREMEQWFFFMPQQEREARGGRPNRTTITGYWKATGSPCYVYSSHHNKAVGLKKTMVFYKGKAPNGKKTKWKMNEYKAIKQDISNNIMTTNIVASSSSSNIPKLRDEFSLCRVYVTSGCARAFDRRPPGTMPNNNNNDNNNNNNNQASQEGIICGAASCSSSPQNANAEAIMLMERSSSTGSSDSGGNDHNTLQEQEATISNNAYDLEMTEALEPLLDWEQLNWL